LRDLVRTELRRRGVLPTLANDVGAEMPDTTPKA